MTRLALDVLTWDNPCVRGPIAMWRDAAPFVQNARGILIHRPRMVNVYRNTTKLHTFIAVRYYCGNGVTGTEKNLTFLSEPPAGSLLCEACESNAVLSAFQRHRRSSESTSMLAGSRQFKPAAIRRASHDNPPHHARRRPRAAAGPWPPGLHEAPVRTAGRDYRQSVRGDAVNMTKKRVAELEGAGIVLLVVFAIVMLAGCTEEPTTINWTADDGLEHYR